MWRERLARQKAQAQAAELHQRLSNQQGGAPAGRAASDDAAAPAGDELDEELMKGLEEETTRADHLRDELRRSKVRPAGADRRLTPGVQAGGQLAGSAGRRPEVGQVQDVGALPRCTSPDSLSAWLM